MAYKFKVGDKGKTRAGAFDYEVLRILSPGGALAVVLTKANGSEGVTTYTSEGRIYLGIDYPLDLTPPEEIIYLNLYRRKSGSIRVGGAYSDQETAIYHRSTFEDETQTWAGVPFTLPRSEL